MRWRAQAKTETISRSLRYRGATIKATDKVCNCGKHRALSLSNDSGQVFRDRICPIAWWLACCNPVSFGTREERSIWMREHSAPQEDWESFVDTLVERI